VCVEGGGPAEGGRVLEIYSDAGLQLIRVCFSLIGTDC